MYYKAIRTKLKLNNTQATLMAKHAGYSRWVYNWGLRLWSEGYKDGLNCGLLIDRDLNAAINLSNWGRLAPGSLPRVNCSHAPNEAESKHPCPDMSGKVSVL
jgi:transposase